MDHVLRDLSAIASQPYIALIILTALAFDFVNGFHDAANSIATIVGTRVLKPFPAVVWAAMWNIVALWVFGFHVADTVSKWVHLEYITHDVIFAGLLSAIIWNLITWYLGLPSSSSHALLGGLCGAALVHAGQWAGVLHTGKVMVTIYFIAVAPLIGLALGWGSTVLLMHLLRRAHPRRLEKHFRYIQLASSALYSLGHGTNDAQKTMGIMAALLYSSIWVDRQEAFVAGQAGIPFWIAAACFLTLGLGTMAGGWRIVKTMGLKITRLQPHGGACAEVSAAVALFLSTHLGIPVSTTHTIAGAIVGVGSVQRLSAVRWGVARNVIWAWIFTIPIAGALGALLQLLLRSR